MKGLLQEDFSIHNQFQTSKTFQTYHESNNFPFYSATREPDSPKAHHSALNWHVFLDLDAHQTSPTKGQPLLPEGILDNHIYLNPNLLKNCAFKPVDWGQKSQGNDKIQRSSRRASEDTASSTPIQAYEAFPESSLLDLSKENCVLGNLEGQSGLSIDSFFVSWSKSEKNEEVQNLEKVPQNPRKNLPGLVLQRVRSSCLGYFESKNQKGVPEKHERFDYIKKIMEKYTQHDWQKLKQYLSQYNKDWKTWKMVGRYLRGPGNSEKMLREIIQAFLGKEGVNDFGDWMRNGKMAKYTRNEIENGKEWIQDKFKELFEADEDKKEGKGARKKQKA